MMEITHPQTPAERAVRSFICVNRMHRGAVERVAEELDLHRSQHIMMIFLAHRASPPTQRQIADALEISPAAVAVTLRKLEACGYVARMAAEHDGRCNEIVLTDAGRRALTLSKERFLAVDTQTFAGFTDKELETLRNYLERMKENLRELAPAERPAECPDPERKEPQTL